MYWQEVLIMLFVICIAIGFVGTHIMTAVLYILCLRLGLRPPFPWWIGAWCRCHSFIRDTSRLPEYRSLRVPAMIQNMMIVIPLVSVAVILVLMIVVAFISQA